MKTLLNNLFSHKCREAWSHTNLQPIEPVFRVNWPLYDKFITERNKTTTEDSRKDMRKGQMNRQKEQRLIKKA